MRQCACHPNTFPILRQRFSILSTAIGQMRQHASTAPALQLLLFPPLRRKKLFVLNEIVATHATQLDKIRELRQKKSSWVIFTGNEPIPIQQDIDISLYVAACSARYAVEHAVVHYSFSRKLTLVIGMVCLGPFFPFDLHLLTTSSSWIQSYCIELIAIRDTTMRI